MMQRPISSLLLATLLSLIVLGPSNAFQLLPVMRLAATRTPIGQLHQPTFLSATRSMKPERLNAVPPTDLYEGASPEDFYQDIVEFKAPDKSDSTSEAEKPSDLTKAVIALRRRLQPNDFETIFDPKNPFIGPL